MRLLLILLLFVVAACADPAAVGDDEEGVDGSYVLVSGRGPDGDLALLDSHRVTLTIDGTQVGGTAACNGYGGTLTAVPPAWATDGLSQTEMACEPPEAMQLESGYLRALAAAEMITTTPSGVTITGPDVELVFETLRPVPTAELSDTRWVLDGLIFGGGDDGAVSSVQSEAVLLLRTDGTVEASTGCRELSGTWLTSGDEILFPDLAADGEACPPELVEQENHVLSVLGDGFIAEVDGQRLTLTDGDLGLSYRAEQ